MRTEKILKAGPFTVLYQNGFLRYIKYGSTEILRMIYFALRDENWGTYEAHTENEQINIQDNSFSITYDCIHRKNETPIFHWKASITAWASGEMIFEIQGKALTDLLKNRAGFCVLHPIRETVEQPCKIIHTDGSITHSIFPKFVAPENPFKSIREFNWAVDNHWFELKFEGDVFETEDQRNWTDASFKTFCTPLDLPSPVRLKKGDTVNQKITFKSKTDLPLIVEQKIDQPNQAIQNDKLPAIGIGASTETDELTPRAIALLRELKLSHYRIEVYPLTESWISKLSIDYQNATALDLPLEVALHLTDLFKEEIDAFVFISLQNRINIKQIILLSENKPVTHQAVIDVSQHIKAQLPKVFIGAGTDFNFTELNRNIFDAQGLDFITFSIHPQEHAFDDLSLLETIEAQTDVVKSAQNIYKEIPIHISPITLRKRFNPYTKSVEKRILSNGDKSDPRQLTTFAADWTERSIRQLTSSGITSITLYQAVGKQGIMSLDGDAHAVYYKLKKIVYGNNLLQSKSEK